MRPIVCIFLSVLIVGAPTIPAGLSGATVRAGERPTDITIQDYLNRSYLDLFEIAPELHVTAADAKQVEEWLKDAKRTCVDRSPRESWWHS